MKKILLTLLVVSSVSAAYAANNSASLNVQGNLTGSCSISLSATQLQFIFTGNAGAVPAGNQNSGFNSTLACSGGTLVQSYAIQSNSGYNLVSGTDAGDTVSYTVTVTSVNAPYTGAQLTQGLVSNSGSLAFNSLFTAATGASGLTIDPLGSPVVLGMLLDTASSLPAQFASGSYSDNLNFSVQY